MKPNPFASVEEYFDEEYEGPSEKVQVLRASDAEDLVITQDQKLKIGYEIIQTTCKKPGNEGYCSFNELWGGLCNIGVIEIPAAREVANTLLRQKQIMEPKPDRFMLV